MGSLIERRRASRHPSTLSSRIVVVNTLRFFWIVLVIWCELGVYFYSLSGCRWPDVPRSREKPSHVLLIADAQVRHPKTAHYELNWLGVFRQHAFDLTLKKSWNVATRLKPHAVVFLGDMLATGKLAPNDHDFELYYQKFQSIFKPVNDVPFYYLPGNNDVGLGLPQILAQNVRRRHVSHFGPLNQRVGLHGHTLLLLDAPGLVQEDYQRAARNKGYDQWPAQPDGTIGFVKSTRPGNNISPIIIFSHIPFARPERAKCGPLREHGTIRKGVGRGYQATLGKQTTTFLLETLRPVAIFSADDRDYCEYSHTLSLDGSGSNTTIPTVKETTVKSFSPANRIRNPGFQLLTLGTPRKNSRFPSFASTACSLPDGYSFAMRTYGLAAALTLLLLYISGRRRAQYERIEPMHLTTEECSSVGSSSGLLLDTPSPWSVQTPLSPRGFVPPSLRSAHGAPGPTYRAFSRPGTPTITPLLSPVILPHDDHDEDGDGEGQFAKYERGWGKPGLLQLPPTNSVSLSGSRSKRWEWSWTFVFKARRRRITIKAPGLESLSKAVTDIFLTLAESCNCIRGPKTRIRRRSILSEAVLDELGVFVVALCTWGFISWMV